MQRFIAPMALAATILSGCSLATPAYPTFSAKAYRIEGNTIPVVSGPSAYSVVYRDGSNFRAETTLRRYGRAIIVFDRVNGGAFILNPTLQQIQIAQGMDVRVEAVTASGADVALHIADADAPQALETQWATLSASSAQSVADCNVAGQLGHEWRHTLTPEVIRSACIAPDGIVLSLRENNRILFEATDLQRGRQNSSLFGIPPSYRLINPGAVAMGADEQLSQINSVPQSRTLAVSPS